MVLLDQILEDLSSNNMDKSYCKVPSYNLCNCNTLVYNIYDQIISSYFTEMMKDISEMSKDIHVISEEDKEKFKEISKVLNFFLPEDSSFSEIDDLLYQKYYKDYKALCNKKDDIICQRFQDIIGGLITPAHLNDYTKSYRKIIYELMDPMLNSANRQFLTFSIKNHEMKINYFHIMMTCYYLLKSNNVLKICETLKILKIVFGKQKNIKELRKPNIISYGKHILRMLYNYSKIPQANQPDIKRITYFITSKSLMLFEQLFGELKDEIPELKKIGISLSYENNPTDFVSNMMEFNYYNVNYFYDFFESKKNDYNKKSIMILGMKGFQRFTLECRVYGAMYNMHRVLNDNDISDEVLRYIDKYYGFGSEPYLMTQTNNALISTSDNNHLQTKGLINSEDNGNADYTIEKYLIYDYVMKYLYILNIFYNGCIEFGTDQNGRQFSQHNLNLIFRYRNRFRETIIKNLLNPSERGNVSWFMETAMKKCPFLFLPPHQEYMMDDLLKMLKGELIGDVIEENLYFATNMNVD